MRNSINNFLTKGCSVESDRKHLAVPKRTGSSDLRRFLRGKPSRLEPNGVELRNSPVVHASSLLFAIVIINTPRVFSSRFLFVVRQ